MAESPTTVTALVGFLPCVDPLMLSEVCAVPEGLPALTALIGLLSRVCPLVVAE